MATTIAAYNVSLALKAGDLIKGAGDARAEIAKLNTVIASIRTPADKYAAALVKLDNALIKGIINKERYNQLLAALNAKYKSLEPVIEKQVSLYERLSVAMGRVISKPIGKITAETTRRMNELNAIITGMPGKLAAITGGFTLGKIVKDSTMLAANFEATSIQFEVLLKSKDKADAMLATLKEFAAKSPLTNEQVQKGAKTMMAFGLEAEKVAPIIKRLGDISLGNAERFEHLALVYGQVRAAGRLMGQDLLQFVNAGFNPLQMMAEKMAKQLGGLSSQYMPALKKAMEDGQISFAMVEDAIREATEAGGLFAGMTERMGETSLGKLAQLHDKFQQLGIAIGNELLPVLNDMVDKVSRILQQLKESGNTPRAWHDFGNVSAAGIGDMASIFTETNSWQERSAKFNEFMRAVNPWKNWGPTKQITPVDQMPKPGFFENAQIQAERQMMRDRNLMQQNINRTVKEAPEKALEAQKQALKQQREQKELQQQTNQLLQTVNQSIRENAFKRFK